MFPERLRFHVAISMNINLTQVVYYVIPTLSSGYLCDSAKTIKELIAIVAFRRGAGRRPLRSGSERGARVLTQISHGGLYILAEIEYNIGIII